MGNGHERQAHVASGRYDDLPQVVLGVRHATLVAHAAVATAAGRKRLLEGPRGVDEGEANGPRERLQHQHQLRHRQGALRQLRAL